MGWYYLFMTLASVGAIVATLTVGYLWWRTSSLVARSTAQEAQEDDRLAEYYSAKFGVPLIEVPLIEVMPDYKIVEEERRTTWNWGPACHTEFLADGVLIDGEAVLTLCSEGSI